MIRLPNLLVFRRNKNNGKVTKFDINNNSSKLF